MRLLYPREIQKRSRVLELGVIREWLCLICKMHPTPIASVALIKAKLVNPGFLEEADESIGSIGWHIGEALIRQVEFLFPEEKLSL